MSSTESSGAPAEGSATPSAANPAAASSFGTSRGSGLARGKRPSVGPAASNNAPASDYKPTAIEVVNAPREYQNPFAPTPATPSVSEAPLASHGTVASPSPTPAPTQPSESAESAPPDVTANDLGTAPTPPPARPVRPARSAPPPATTSGEDLFPLDPAAPRPGNADEKAELNILPPERPKSVAPQTWESEGFRPQQREGREVRADRPERTERPERTDRPDRPRRDDRFGGERREREGNRAGFEPREGREHSRRPERGEFRREESSRPSPTPSPVAPPAPAKTGGFLGWLKSLFGGAEEAKPVTPARETGYRPGGRDGGHGQRQHRAGGGGRGGQRQHRGGGYGHGSGQGGENPAGGAEGQSHGGEHRGGDREGFRRRRRGGRGRGQYRGEGRGGDHRGGGGESHPQA